MMGLVEGEEKEVSGRLGIVAGRINGVRKMRNGHEFGRDSHFWEENSELSGGLRGVLDEVAGATKAGMWGRN